MRTLYFGHDQIIRQRFPNLHPLVDADLVTALSSYYRLSEAEQDGKFYLVFDYSPTLPAQEEARAALPLGILERTFAVLEFDAAEDRDQEIAAVRCSLWDDRDDDSTGVPAGIVPFPPARVGQNAKAIGAESLRDWG